MHSMRAVSEPLSAPSPSSGRDAVPSDEASFPPTDASLSFQPSSLAIQTECPVVEQCHS